MKGTSIEVNFSGSTRQRCTAHHTEKLVCGVRCFDNCAAVKTHAIEIDFDLSCATIYGAMSLPSWYLVL